MRRVIVHNTESANHKRVVTSVQKHKNDTTVSNRGYIVEGAEMRIKIQQIEKELVETRTSLYGKANTLSKSHFFMHSNCSEFPNSSNAT